MAARNPSPQGPLLAQLCRLLPRASRLRRAPTTPCTPEVPRCFFSAHAMVEYHNAIFKHNSIRMPYKYNVIFSAQGHNKLTSCFEGESVIRPDLRTQQVLQSQQTFYMLLASPVYSTNACRPNRVKVQVENLLRMLTHFAASCPAVPGCARREQHRRAVSGRLNPARSRLRHVE